MSQTKKVSKEANIRLRVRRDDQDNIETIDWQATDAPTNGKQSANAMILALWDPEERNSLRIDLWTKAMTVEDMNDFFFPDAPDDGGHLQKRDEQLGDLWRTSRRLRGSLRRRRRRKSSEALESFDFRLRLGGLTAWGGIGSRGA